VEVRELPRVDTSGPMELWALRAGLKPVAFLTVEPAHEPALRARIAAIGEVHVERRERRVEIAAGDRWIDVRAQGEPRIELYVARDAAAARRAVALQTEGDPTRDAAELGALMGYPRCCVDAFIAQPTRGDNTRNRYLVAARTPTGERAWPWQLNELHVRLVPFFPCSYRCVAAVAFAEAALAALDAVHPGAVARLRAQLARPVLYLEHAQQLWLTGHGDPSHARYRAIHRVGDAPALATLGTALARGDMVTLADDAFVVTADGAPVATVSRARDRPGLLAPFGDPT
jgi:hypothetical protein